MKALTSYMTNLGKICPMVLLVDGELKRNAGDVAASINLSDGEKARLLEWIDEARASCARLLQTGLKPDSVRGGAVRRHVYQMLRSDVDVITMSETGKFGNTEIKYALKPYTYGPFSQKESFVNRVAVKFDQLEGELSKDGEEFDLLRAILVSDDHFSLLQTAVSDLVNVQEVFSSDGRKHAYLLCTLSGLIDYRSGKMPCGGVFRFVL